MAGLGNVISTDLSGLEAYRTALNTISNNITNVNTPGYARRSTDLSTVYTQGSDRVIGSGVEVAGIDRMSSQLADTRLRTAIAGQGRADTLLSALKSVQSNFTGAGGITKTIDQFFSDAKTVASKPSDVPSRQTLLADTKQLAASFNRTASNISGSLRSLTQQGQDQASQVNSLLRKLADLNETLRNSQGSSNSLKDNQAQALQKLSKLIGVNVLRNANGTVRVSVRGQVLLGGSGASQLSFQQPDGTTRAQVMLPNGRPLGSSAVSGQIGGTLAAFSQASQQLQGLNRMATVTAGLINSQNAQGLTLNGQQGGQLMTMPTPSVIGQNGNTGTASLNASIRDASKLAASGGPYAIDYRDGQWTATNQATGKQMNVGSGDSFQFKGVSVTVDGTPADQDRFILDPVSGAANGVSSATSDPADIAAAAPYVAQPGLINSDGEVANSNAGEATVVAGQVTGKPGPQTVKVDSQTFGQDLELTFTDADQFQIQTRDGTTIASGTYDSEQGKTIALEYPDGLAGGKYWTMDVQGQPAAGDTFTLRPGGPQSGENADALGALPNRQLIQGESLSDVNADLTARVGSAVQSAQNSAENASVSVENATNARSEISGVSLDQQAAQIQKYSRAYQASAKALSTVNSLFQNLLNVA